MLLLIVYLTGMSHYLGHLSYICSPVFVWKPPGRNQDLSKKHPIPESTSIPRSRIRTYRQKARLENKGTDTFTLKSSRVYCADLGTQNPYTIHAEKLSAQAQDLTTISSCLEHAKTAKEGSAATAPARKAWGIFPKRRNLSPCPQPSCELGI